MTPHQSCRQLSQQLLTVTAAPPRPALKPVWVCFRSQARSRVKKRECVGEREKARRRASQTARRCKNSFFYSCLSVLPPRPSCPISKGLIGAGSVAKKAHTHTHTRRKKLFPVREGSMNIQIPASTMRRNPLFDSTKGIKAEV